MVSVLPDLFVCPLGGPGFAGLISLGEVPGAGPCSRALLQAALRSAALVTLVGPHGLS